MNSSSRTPQILVLTGGLIHLVHQLAVASTIGPKGDHPPAIHIVVTGVLRRKPDALAGIHREIGAWLAVLRQRLPNRYGGVQLVQQPKALEPSPWDWALLNNQWLETQRQVIDQLGIQKIVVCGDGLGVYYRCPRELRALVPSLLGLPIPEPGRTVRYVLSGRQPRWHRPPPRPLPVPLAGRRELFDTLVEALRERGQSELEAVLREANPRRPLWLCSVPNLAHQFPGERIPQEVLRSWVGALQREGFQPGIDQLQLMDHPKAPSGGSFGPVTEPWLAPPLRSSLPLEVLIALLEEARPEGGIVVCGMTSALYGVRALTGATVRWLGLAPLWWFNPLYRQQPLEFLHRGLRKARMAWLTAQI
ncbi:MAG: hypothetical protein VKK99_05345 [Cyanobacteriota bacterium]|nr:hypothetical protein [Cyanobacteriota bacterium]